MFPKAHHFKLKPTTFRDASGNLCALKPTTPGPKPTNWIPSTPWNKWQMQCWLGAQEKFVFYNEINDLEYENKQIAWGIHHLHTPKKQETSKSLGTSM